MTRKLLITAAAMLVAAVVAAAAVGSTPTRHVVTTAKNTKLGKVILVNTKGRTLYWLSVETKTHLVCKSKCLSFWPPLYLPGTAKPTGAPALGTTKRSDNGKRQVTFQGHLLYTFTGDHAAGQANGEGFKDVGVWHAAFTAKLSSGGGGGTTSTTSTTTTTSGGGGYGGGGGGY